MAAAGRPGFPRRGRRAQQYADHLADDADGLEAEKGGESVAFPGGGESARAGLGWGFSARAGGGRRSFSPTPLRNSGVRSGGCNRRRPKDVGIPQRRQPNGGAED
jgi:hypothetical protein